MALLFLFQLASPFRADAQIFKSKKTKKIEQENIKLKRQLDSLNNLVNDYMFLLDYQDSLSRTFQYEDELINSGETSDFIYTPHITDSLLNVWYIHRNASKKMAEYFDYNMDSIRFTSKTPDKVYIERLDKMNSPITLPYNETVKNYMILYSEKMPTKMAEMLGLAEYYFPIFEETFNRYDMPEELKYMAVIESALNPTAVSRAGAKGMWQFMYHTAKSYGLIINSFVDERLDPVKSADAAARYLKDAYRVFGDWNLAISSYNCGSGNVNKAIRRCGNNKDFWNIYDYLPRETRGYVPAFVGAMYAFTYKDQCGLKPKKISTPVHIDTFHIKKNLHFQQIADLTGISVETLRGLNPQFVHDIIPGKDKEYVLRIPSRFTAEFIAQEDTLYSHRAKELFNPTVLENIRNTGSAYETERIVYRVKKGDYLGRIATRYKVKVSDIRKWNHMKNNNLRIGQRLIIYKRGAMKKKPMPVKNVSLEAQKKAREQAVKDSLANRRARAVADSIFRANRQADSLALIAKQAEADSLEKINALKQEEEAAKAARAKAIARKAKADTIARKAKVDSIATVQKAKADSLADSNNFEDYFD